MSQSLVQNYVHIVFSVKLRQELIDTKIAPDLFKYLSGTCASVGCHPIAVGGYLNHVHILCNLSKSLPLQDFVKDLKIASSKWMKTQGQQYTQFYWQDGYGAFSVGRNELERIKKYVLNQETHHRKNSFKEEYLEILRINDVNFNPEYVFRD